MQGKDHNPHLLNSKSKHEWIRDLHFAWTIKKVLASCCSYFQVSAVSVKPTDQSHKLNPVPIPEMDMPSKGNDSGETDMIEMESSISVADSSEEIRPCITAALRPRKLLQKRKGIPCRAPFCWCVSEIKMLHPFICFSFHSLYFFLFVTSTFLPFLRHLNRNTAAIIIL